MFDCNKFLLENRIPIPEGGNTGPGWINIRCPFCKDHSNHLGWEEQKQYFNCWHCGYHTIIDVIMGLLNCDYKNARLILKKYTTGAKYIPKHQKEISIRKNENIKLPPGSEKLKYIHRKYLIDRDFDPDFIIKKYNLKGTNYIGDYKFRIIAPIYYKGTLVSYQGRDITEKHKLRYKACSKKNEIIHHKHILYNLDNCLSNKVIIVEGITDVWRVGDNCACTFGIAYTLEQVYLLSKRFNTIFILYDSEEKAQEKAYNLARNLNVFDIKTEIISFNFGDPAEIDDKTIFQMKKELLI